LTRSRLFDLLFLGVGTGEAAMGWAYSVDLRERVVAAFDRAGMKPLRL